MTDPSIIRIAMLGMVEGNGHPYSWSAIINGDYDAKAMAECGYPAIPVYLDPQPKSNLGIPGAQVTHIWCDNPEDANGVAAATYIPNVVENPEDVIGNVDAVIIATDVGHEHVERARPFIEANIPTFIDKPLTDNIKDLNTFIDWQRAGKPIMSTSCMRYARECAELRGRMNAIGEPRLITTTMAKSWERYGIHAIETIYPFLAPGGYESVRHSGTTDHNIVHLHHTDNVEIVIAVIDDMFGAYGHVNLYGTTGSDSTKFADTFHAFKSQLEAFVSFVRTGTSPVPFDETIEQIKIVIAAIKSREQGGTCIRLEDL